MAYKILQLPADQWVGLTDADDNDKPLKIQNLSPGIVRIMEIDTLEDAQNLDRGFVISERQFFETTGNNPVFFNAFLPGQIIYMVDVRA